MYISIPFHILFHCASSQDVEHRSLRSKSLTSEAKLQTFKEVNMHSQVQSRKSVLFEEALLALETQDPSVELYRKVAAAIQSAVQCYRVIYGKK